MMHHHQQPHQHHPHHGDLGVRDQESPSCSPAMMTSLNAPRYGTTVPNRIFVGGITTDTTECDLESLFTRFGSVNAVKIINDRAGVPRGYGFITFDTEEEAKRVLREGDSLMLKGRKLNVAIAIKKQQVGRIEGTSQFLPNGPMIPFGNGITFPSPYDAYYTTEPAMYSFGPGPVTSGGGISSTGSTHLTQQQLQSLAHHHASGSGAGGSLPPAGYPSFFYPPQPTQFAFISPPLPPGSQGGGGGPGSSSQHHPHHQQQQQHLHHTLNPHHPHHQQHQPASHLQHHHPHHGPFSGGVAGSPSVSGTPSLQSPHAPYITPYIMPQVMVNNPMNHVS